MVCCEGTCCEGWKAIVWIYWSVNTFIGCIYSGLALASFSAVQSGTENLDTGGGTQTLTYRNSLMASCMLGFLIVLFFMIFSFLVLICKHVFSDVKLAYGIMLGCAIHTAWFLLLAGLVLNNRDVDMQTLKDAGIWSSATYTTYQATYVFSYIQSGLYICAFFILFFGRHHIGKVEGPGGSGPSQPVNVYVDMGSMSKTQSGSMSMQRNNQV